MVMLSWDSAGFMAFRGFVGFRNALSGSFKGFHSIPNGSKRDLDGFCRVLRDTVVVPWDSEGL